MKFEEGMQLYAVRLATTGADDHYEVPYEVFYEVSRNGCVQIEIVMQNGQMAEIPWIKVTFCDGISILVNMAYVISVELLRQPVNKMEEPSTEYEATSECGGIAESPTSISKPPSYKDWQVGDWVILKDTCGYRSVSLDTPYQIIELSGDNQDEICLITLNVAGMALNFTLGEIRSGEVVFYEKGANVSVGFKDWKRGDIVTVHGCRGRYRDLKDGQELVVERVQEGGVDCSGWVDGEWYTYMFTAKEIQRGELKWEGRDE